MNMCMIFLCWPTCVYCGVTIYIVVVLILTYTGFGTSIVGVPGITPSNIAVIRSIDLTGETTGTAVWRETYTYYSKTHSSHIRGE